MAGDERTRDMAGDERTAMVRFEGTELPVGYSQVSIPHSNSQVQMAEIQEELEEMKENEEELVFQLETLEKAHQKRTQPMREELENLRSTMREKESELWRIEHGEEVRVKNANFVFVQSYWFSTLCSLVIVANLVVMVLQLKNAKLLGDWSSTVDLCFLVFYCLELILKGFCYESRLLCGHCHVVWWNWLDLIIVLSGITELILPLLVSGHSPLHLSGLRGLRLLRLARLARGLKLLRYLCESDLSWTQHQFFETLMMSVIVVNAVVMWLELDYPGPLWRWVEEFFLVIYVFELCARLAYHGRSYFVHENWTWNYLDFVIVFFGVLEQWMLPLYHAIYALIMGHASTATLSMNLVRALRIVRVFRVLRLARLLRGVKQLYKLIHGVVESMASVGWVITLTFILLYSASLVFTTLVGRGYIYADPSEIPEEASENFGSVWRSFLALFKLMNDDQSVVEKIISTVGGQILFYAFMMLSNWMMLAILTSVISDNMMSVSRVKEEEDRKKAMSDKQEHAKRQITNIFLKLDEDESGSISEQEMMKLLGDPELKMELCEAAGLDAADLVEMLHCASYKTKSEGSVILYKQFLTMLQDESATARERSIFKVLENMRAMEFRLENRLNAALQKLDVTDTELNNLPSLTHELEKTRGLEDSPARHLVNQLLPTAVESPKGSPRKAK
ncbi:unnamed protein product [Cladocopium goreaui]|uniref:Voltage-dependent N-type calcium channel subunit alpha-1B n=2 Tax=Cladocopium goreaui TaxID=2562237 RepID=A0A9P1G109_9DINO|nr:unnamed protein product [Cladocopium goreaui]